MLDLHGLGWVEDTKIIAAVSPEIKQNPNTWDASLHSLFRQLTWVPTWQSPAVKVLVEGERPRGFPRILRSPRLSCESGLSQETGRLQAAEGRMAPLHEDGDGLRCCCEHRQCSEPIKPEKTRLREGWGSGGGKRERGAGFRTDTWGLYIETLGF